MSTAQPKAPAFPKRFPWPFTGDTYRYSANVEPAPSERTTAAGSWGSTILDADELYEAELAERARILEEDPKRYAESPHMRPASWEALEYLLDQLASTYPQHMRYLKDGPERHWHNGRLGTDVGFTFGDDSSLGMPPLIFAASQVQDDIALLDQREDDLFLEAGVLTFGSNWSLEFDLGMNFLEIHGPVPRNYADGAMPRALSFLKRLEPGQVYRRLNWSSTVGGRLDISIEKYDRWGIDRKRIADMDLGENFTLRVELQHLVRLPESNAIMFLIHTHFATLNQIAMVPGWACQFANVLESAPDEMLSYKSFIKIKEPLITWLRAHQDDAAQGRLRRGPGPLPGS